MNSLDTPTNTPSSNEIKLIIDVVLLEQEKRITKILGDQISTQNKTYLDHILEANTRITEHSGLIDKLQEQLKSLKWLVATASSASGVLAGLIGFFIGQSK